MNLSIFCLLNMKLRPCGMAKAGLQIYFLFHFIARVRRTREVMFLLCLSVHRIIMDHLSTGEDIFVDPQRSPYRAPGQTLHFVGLHTVGHHTGHAWTRWPDPSYSGPVGFHTCPFIQAHKWNVRKSCMFDFPFPTVFKRPPCQVQLCTQFKKKRVTIFCDQKLSHRSSADSMKNEKNPKCRVSVEISSYRRFWFRFQSSIGSRKPHTLQPLHSLINLLAGSCIEFLCPFPGFTKLKLFAEDDLSIRRSEFENWFILKWHILQGKKGCQFCSRKKSLYFILSRDRGFKGALWTFKQELM